MRRFLSSGFVAVVLLGAVACDAQRPCQKAFELESEVRACRVGAEEIGYKNGGKLDDAEKECNKRYSGTQELNLACLGGAVSVLGSKYASTKCYEEYSRESELLACRLGSELFGPRGGDSAKKDCANLFDIRKVDPALPDHFERASQIADFFIACKKGADAFAKLGTGFSGSYDSYSGCEQVTISGITRCY